MASPEPSLWTHVVAIPFILVVALIQFVFATGLFILGLFVAAIVFTGALRFCGHIIYSVTAICFGPESRLCGLILELEQEELAYRVKRHRKALEAAQRHDSAIASIATQEPAATVIVDVR